MRVPRSHPAASIPSVHLPPPAIVEESPMFSELLLDHFRNPRNVGTLDESAAHVRVENPACGDVLELSAIPENGLIREVRYQVRGCTASIAAGSATTCLLEGQPIASLTSIGTAQIEEAVGGLESASKHAARLCADGIKALAAELRKSG